MEIWIICVTLMLQLVICFSHLNLQSKMCQNEGRRWSTGAFNPNVSKRIFTQHAAMKPVVTPACWHPSAGLCGAFRRPLPPHRDDCVTDVRALKTLTSRWNASWRNELAPSRLSQTPTSAAQYRLRSAKKKKYKKTHHTFKLLPHLWS